MAEFSKYVGLDVHKETMNVAVAGGPRAAALLGRDRESSRRGEETVGAAESQRREAAVVLRGGAVRLRALPADRRGRSRLRGGGAVVDSNQARATDQDQPPRLPEPGAAGSRRRADHGLGSRRRAGSATRSQPRARGHENPRQATAPEAERISVAARTDLRGPPALDAAVLALARDAAFRVALSADRARRVRRRSAAGAERVRRGWSEQLFEASEDLEPRRGGAGGDGAARRGSTAADHVAGRARRPEPLCESVRANELLSGWFPASIPAGTSGARAV